MSNNPPITSIWILEPEPEFRMLMEKLSLIYGNPTRVAHDLPSAFALLQNAELANPPPRLALLNWRLGAKATAQWAKQIQERYPSCQILCLSPFTPPQGIFPPGVQFPRYPEFFSELLQLFARPEVSA